MTLWYFHIPHEFDGTIWYGMWWAALGTLKTVCIYSRHSCDILFMFVVQEDKKSHFYHIPQGQGISAKQAFLWFCDYTHKSSIKPTKKNKRKKITRKLFWKLKFVLTPFPLFHRIIVVVTRASIIIIKLLFSDYYFQEKINV